MQIDSDEPGELLAPALDENEASVSVNATSAPDPQPAAKRPGRGAPIGNVNFAGGNQDKKLQAALARLLKKPARERRTKERRQHEDEAREIMAELRVPDLAVSRRAARRLADTEEEIGYNKALMDRRGRYGRDGEPKAWYSAWQQLTTGDRVELRRLLEDIRELAGSNQVDPTGDAVFVCQYADGSLASRPRAPGDPPPRDTLPDLGVSRQAASGAVLPLGETVGTLPAAGRTEAPVPSAKGAKAQVSLGRRLARYLEREAPVADEEPLPDPQAARDAAWRSGRPVPGMRSFEID
jgi:hypothetical protein